MKQAAQMPWMTPERIAYESTPEWRAYRDAAEDWDACHEEYIACGSSVNRTALLAAESRKNELLAIVRATPEHKACFGY